jgi:ketosteroid isomerase-like protein
VQAAQRAYEAWTRRDLAAIQALCTPDVVIVQPPEVPDAKSYEGPDAMIAALEDWPQEWNDFHVELVEIIDVSDDVLITVTRHSGRGASSGIDVDFHVFYVSRLRDGALARMEMYFTAEQARRASRLED